MSATVSIVIHLPSPQRMRKKVTFGHLDGGHWRTSAVSKDFALSMLHESSHCFENFLTRRTFRESGSALRLPW